MLALVYNMNLAYKTNILSRAFSIEDSAAVRCFNSYNIIIKKGTPKHLIILNILRIIISIYIPCRNIYNSWLFAPMNLKRHLWHMFLIHASLLNMKNPESKLGFWRDIVPQNQKPKTPKPTNLWKIIEYIYIYSKNSLNYN